MPYTEIRLVLPRFWKRARYVPLYMRQTANDLTGEHTCVMVRGLNSSSESELEWIEEFAKGMSGFLFFQHDFDQYLYD
jgi:tRNA(Met) C34 N-acetyltransferase TmcA